MLNCYWLRASQGFSWTVYFLLLTSYCVLSENSQSGPAYGSVRLVNGTSIAGRVEVFYDGAWGTICGGDYWGENEAKVVCKSLGFKSGEVLPVTGGSGNIFLADVNCDGTEESIVSCTHNNFQENNCKHDSDVGVKCEGSADEITSDYVNDCNFQRGLCNYTIQNNGSNSVNGRFSWFRISGETASDGTGPSKDHTYEDKQGYYVYTEASVGSSGDVTRLISRKSIYSPSSIQFWYHMYGSNMGTLKVITVKNNSKKIIWSQSGNKGNSWKYASIQVNSTFEQLIFEGVRGSTYLRDIAIDDIVFSENSDADGDCNFEQGLCNYTIQSKGSNSYSWVRTTRRTLSFDTGPTYDHTYGNMLGYYVYTEASVGSFGDVTRLISRKSIYSPSTIQFWYHMYGSDIGTLNVITVMNNREKIIWSQSGNKGNSWKNASIQVNSAFEQLIFEGVKGSTYLGDIAIDDIVFSGNLPKDPETVNCTFQNGLCGYKTVKGNDLSITWSLISGSNDKAPISDHTNNSSGKYVSMIVNSAKEGMKSYLVSPPIKASDEMKVEFFYYMSGPMPGELHVSYKDKSTPLSSWDKNEWHDSGDHGTRWNYGCMDLYPDLKQDGNAIDKSIVFTGITGTSSGIHLALDDIKLSNGSCEIGIDAQVCTFDNPKLCHYTINCTGRLEYTWRRMQGQTPTMNTGPNNDASKNGNGYYLYAESSYGTSGDAVSIEFSVNDTKGKYLKFNYHMYGQSMGSLHLFYTSGHSSREVWQMSGNQGNVWNFFCRQINEEIDEVNLVAVRGSRYTSDIALDNVFLTSQPCPNPINCNFNNGMCNYTMTYTSSRYKWILVSGNDSTNGLGKYLLANSSNGMEGDSTTVAAIFTGKTSNNSNIQFYYNANVIGSSKLIVEIKRLSALTTVNVLKRKFLNMAAHGWVIGCIDLPANESISVNFIGIRGSSDIMLDDISYNESPCVDGIMNNICTFEEPNVCGYKVSCRDATKFLWKRGQRTDSPLTGPSSDHSGNGNTYFMYTDSSFGDPGDTTELLFPEFVTPPGHYLSFYYYMQGRDIGTLQVHIITRSGKMLKWSEKGEMGRNWVKGCVSLPVNETTTVVFTGIRGNGPLGDIAIDDVGVVPGVCSDEGIPCDFNDETLCGYTNMSYTNNSGWFRKQSGSGYYMNAVGSYGKISLKSPSRNLSDSCVQITYRIRGIYRRLNVYTYYNNQKHLSLKENNNMEWQKAQFYIQNAETSLIFEADIRSNWMNSVVNIDKIAILNGTCPVLDCRNATQACIDQGHCVDKSSLCDKEDDCYDGSDESNCSQSISCDFEEKSICGYNYTFGWSREKLSTYGLSEIILNNSEYSMILTSGMGPLMSPFEIVSQSCVQFYHIGDVGSLLMVNAIYGNGSASNVWLSSYNSFKTWTLGQFEIPGGNISFMFTGFNIHFGIAIDNIKLQKGDCGTIVCPDDFFTCVSNEKCIPHRSKCNQNKDCADNSDEVNCTSSIDCDFEDPYECGYEYNFRTWSVISGKDATYPDLDHSSGLYSGKFFVSSFNKYSQDIPHNLYAPEEMLPFDACLTFYYTFHGFGEFKILDNGVSVLKIRSNNINTWQKSQIQLSPGKHNITFSHTKGKNEDLMPYNVLGLDSIHLSNGTCKLFECEKGWRKCSNSSVCVPEFKFCDHDEDCANGEDERNCTTYFNVRLVRGRNVQQGEVEMYYNGKWNSVCGSWTSQNSAVVCRELGYNVSRNTFTTKHSLRTSSKVSFIICSGSENSLKSCRANFCSGVCFCSVYSTVDCSNTLCESTHVPCVPNNVTNSSITISNPQCIWKESVCDGEKDCPGGTDEQSCTKCEPNEFQCLNYECIPQNKRCDGINNCKDGSDEYHCFKHNNSILLVMLNGWYLPVCEDNLKEQDIANKLCHYVGKGDASVGLSNTQGTGVKFSFSADAKHSVLPGLKPSLTSCPLLSLNCSRRECGTRSATLYDPVIRHGQKAIPGEWPWQVAVMYRGNFSCGGVLLNNRYVLSAAYCFRNSTLPQDYEIGLGSTVLSLLRKIAVKKIKLHENYTSVYKRNDVALLELMTPEHITDYIRPVCLPSKSWEPYMICYTTGWGEDETGEQANYLMETKVKILPRHSCYAQYTSADPTGICANHNQPNQPACYGDEGGPLVCRNMQGYWSVYGVVSQGLNTCRMRRADSQLYADIFTLRKWITDNMMN